MSEFPKIFVSSDPSMFDESIHITLEGLPPCKVVTIYATAVATKFCTYESFANYKVSSNGTVDLQTDSSVCGTYTGVEPMGLLWSMLPCYDTKKHIARLRKRDVTKPQTYHLQVFDEAKHSLEECRNSRKSKVLASTALNRWFMAPGVRRIPVRENGIIATLFLPPGEGPFPGVINLFGGVPGLLEYKSSLHASHGFAALALAYLGMENQPANATDELDLEYFEKAVQFMMTHKDVLSENGIGVYSICKGGQIALMMATYLKDVRCVVSINGIFHIGKNEMKYKGQQFEGYDTGNFNYSQLDPDVDNDLIGMYANAVGDMKNLEKLSGFIPFHKRHEVSYMIVAGLGDTTMPSRPFVGEMERLLHEENHPDFEILKYNDAGHLIEPPNVPFVPIYYQPGPTFNVFVTTGGNVMPHMKSQEDCWPKIMRFMKEKLASSPAFSKSKL